MSGPIVRKYGFPNFEKIFGKRALEHGVEDLEKTEETPRPETPQGAGSAHGAASGNEEPKRKADEA